MEYFKKLLGAVEARLEWWMAVRWAKKFHPAWVEIYKRVRNEYVRQVYRILILKRYWEMRGDQR
jgi:hypothetical protein